MGGRDAMTVDAHSYLASFEILCDDFRRTTEYIEPTDDNLRTFSHRLYELLLRACTDFESICKEELVSAGYAKPPHTMNINDYKTLEAKFTLEQQYIGVLIWRPVPAYIQPFLDWSTASPPLAWYGAYNEVKHNRNLRFAYANLDNVRHALAGLFAILVSLKVIHENQFGFQERDAPNGFREKVYPRQIFSWAWPK